jgi:hypothetical protein
LGWGEIGIPQNHLGWGGSLPPPAFSECLTFMSFMHHKAQGKDYRELKHMEIARVRRVGFFSPTP